MTAREGLPAAPTPLEETPEPRLAISMVPRLQLVRLVALVTLGSGLVNVWSVIGRSLPHRMERVRDVFPLEFVHLSRFAVLLAGFALIISSIYLYRRKSRAFDLVAVLAAGSVVFHLSKGLDYEEATASALLLVVLFVARKEFVVGSGLPDFRRALLGLSVALLTTLAYGVAGFWVLDRREFGINFTFGDSLHRTLLFLSLIGDPGVIPRTRYAHWFVDSLYLITGATVAYAVFALYRPVVYRFRTLPHERGEAHQLTTEHGKSSLDYFKHWVDKSFFFSVNRKCFIAYRVGGSYAMVLGDPTGPDDEIEPTIRAFEAFCQENDWRVAFDQTLPDYLAIYKKLGYRRLKIGDDAIVALDKFALEGKDFRKMRARNNKLEKEGVRFVHWAPPIPADVLRKAREVSDAWLQIPGRRERTFTLGLFEPSYVRQTTVLGAVDSDGKLLAFANLIPSYKPGESTIDLMRHRADAPQGMMDYLFCNILLFAKQQGYQRFNLGMAPMAGFREHEESTPEERAVHYFMQQMNFLFSYQGLRHFKGKFASFWEPRYLMYKNVLNLPRVARAIAEVSELHD